MAYTVTFNAELNIIETKVQGDLQFDEAKELAGEIVNAIIQYNCFFVSAIIARRRCAFPP